MNILSSLTHTHARDVSIFRRASQVILKFTFILVMAVLLLVIPLADIIIGFILGAPYVAGYVLVPFFVIAGGIVIIESIFVRMGIVLERTNALIIALALALLPRLTLYTSLLVIEYPQNLFYLPLVLAIFVVISHSILIIIIFLAFRDIITNCMKDVAKILLIGGLLAYVSWCLLILVKLNRILLACIILVLYILIMGRAGIFKAMDFIILRKALPRNLSKLVVLLEKITKKHPNHNVG